MVALQTNAAAEKIFRVDAAGDEIGIGNGRLGAAFAVSFDTVSHAAAFSLSGATMAGVLFAALLGMVFTLGMVLTDTVNGLWAAKMMAGSPGASRWMSGAVAFLCLSIAALAFLRQASPAVDGLAERLSLPLAAAALLLITGVAAFGVSRR